MKKSVVFSVMLVGCFVFALENEHNVSMTPKEQGISYIKMLGGTLKEQLESQMKADPSGQKAMDFCAVKADEITKEINQKLPKGATVRRTSLKTRNPKNAGTIEDMVAIKEYQEKIKNGTFSPDEILVKEKNGVTHIYKPLVTTNACLTCHGENIAPAIKAKIDTNYPHDLATGFKAGTLRGVIVADIKQK